MFFLHILILYHLLEEVIFTLYYLYTTTKAIRETENLNDGEVFLVKDLFKGYVGNRIPRKDRLLLGTLFLNHVSKMNGNLKAIEKTSSNQQRYKKTIDKF